MRRFVFGILALVAYAGTASAAPPSLSALSANTSPASAPIATSVTKTAVVSTGAAQSAASSKPALDLDLRTVKLDGRHARAPKVNGVGDLGITVDPELQREIERILVRAKAPSGAIVMSDVRTGRIIAWASLGNEGDLVRTARYPGASLFKVVTAATLLQEGFVKPSDTECYGGGESRLHDVDVEPGCHPGDQRTRFDKALGKSINGVFARLALKHLAPNDLNSMARALGMGDSPPFDLSADKSFVKLPSERLGFARAAAGFGDAKASPLSALFMMQTIANGGDRVRLHVTGDPADVPRVSAGRAISKETATELTRMLEVTTRAGTSRKAFRTMEGRPHLSVAGKTGTLMLEHPKRLISWFAGFAPSKNPEIAISVLLANDEKWWRKGNEVARDAIDAYFALHSKASPSVAGQSPNLGTSTRAR
jgi:peptidoglycan glycosyltransferase